MLDNINDVVDSWLELFLNVCKECISNKTVVVRPLMTNEIRHSFRDRDWCLERYKPMLSEHKITLSYPGGKLIYLRRDGKI